MGNDLTLPTGLRKTVLNSNPLPLCRFPPSGRRQKSKITRHEKPGNGDNRSPLHMEIPQTLATEPSDEVVLRTLPDQERVQRIDVQVRSFRKYRTRKYPTRSPLHFHKSDAHPSISPIARDLDPTPRLVLESIPFDDSRELEQAKSARLVKRYKLNKQKFSEATLSSSEEELRRDEGMTPQDVSPRVGSSELAGKGKGLSAISSFKPRDTTPSIILTRESGTDHRSSIFSFAPKPLQVRKNGRKKSLLLVRNPETPVSKEKRVLPPIELPKRS